MEAEGLIELDGGLRRRRGYIDLLRPMFPRKRKEPGGDAGPEPLSSVGSTDLEIGELVDAGANGGRQQAEGDESRTVEGPQRRSADAEVLSAKGDLLGDGVFTFPFRKESRDIPFDIDPLQVTIAG